MRIRDIMIRQVVTVTPQTTYEEAARILYGNHVSGAPVVDLRGAIVGIISEKDLFRALYPFYGDYMREHHAYDQEQRENEVSSLRRQPIEKYMAAPAITVDADAPILRAGGLLLAHCLHRLPVVEHGKLVGIVTREDIFRTILQHHLFALHIKKVDKKYVTTSHG